MSIIVKKIRINIFGVEKWLVQTKANNTKNWFIRPKNKIHEEGIWLGQEV